MASAATTAAPGPPLERASCVVEVDGDAKRITLGCGLIAGICCGSRAVLPGALVLVLSPGAVKAARQPNSPCAGERKFFECRMRGGMVRWRKRLFAFLNANGRPVTGYFGLPQTAWSIWARRSSYARRFLPGIVQRSRCSWRWTGPTEFLIPPDRSTGLRERTAARSSGQSVPLVTDIADEPMAQRRRSNTSGSRGEPD